jgi:plastocyanin
MDVERLCDFCRRAAPDQTNSPTGGNKRLPQVVKAEEAQHLVSSKKERSIMLYALRKGALLTALVLCNTLLAACGGQSGGANDPVEKAGNTPQAADREAATVQIRIDNFTFEPAEVTIPAGTKVTWVNHDDVPHTATSTARPRQFDSGTLDTDEQFSHVFATPGTFDYFCALHKHMTARIIIK